ncbi:MAG: zinc-ribbon domain-containing protein [Deltaproteobacteria bacterium]|nr:zinc-ribbon domain-containing protein [Deltaproteobacteria bacterium]
MIITCEECQTKFRVADELIKQTGSRVRCSNCQHIFTVFRAPDEPEPSRSPEEEPCNSQNRNPRSSNPYDQGSMDALDRELDDLFDSDRTPSPRNRRPVLLARPPYPAERFLPAEPPGRGADPAAGHESAGSNKVQPGFPLDYPGEEPAADFGGRSISPYEENEPDFEDLGSNNFDLGLSDEPVTAGPVRRKVIFEKAPEDVPVSDGPYEMTGGPEPAGSPSDPLPPGPALSRQPKKREPASSNRKFFLIAAIVIAFLVIGLFFLSVWQKPQSQVALQATGLNSPEDPGPGSVPGSADRPADEAGSDPNNSARLNFVQDQESHHYRINRSSGRILIITGRISNGYPARRSFIRLKGSLKDSKGEVVAERQVFAGNYLTEEELTSLPMPEILARLSLKGGQDNSNVNVPPNKAVPFMLVFDRLPEDLEAYILEPVSSAP